MGTVKRETVSSVNCTSYDPAAMDAAVERHFRALEAEGPLIAPGNRVLIKPNLIMRRRPEEAATTHPEFVAALVRAVKRRGGAPVIADSPGGPYTHALLRAVYAGTGMEAVAEREGAELNYDLGTTPRPTNGGRVCSSFDLINPVAKADVVITAAKLKTHGQMTYSGAVKNLFGSLPGLTKPEFHYRYPEKTVFGEMLVDLCETVKPAAAFLDGVVGMEGDGPTAGTPKPFGVTLASRNPHALDLLACSLIGFDARAIPTLAAAIGRGLCAPDASALDVAGDEPPRLRFKAPASSELDFASHMPPFLRGALQKLFTPRPVIQTALCVGCGKCAQSCPQKVIRIENGKAVIHYENCIRCFCCHEMCPERAVSIRRFRLFGGKGAR